MAKSKRSSKGHLPTKSPRRSGKRGIGPVEDSAVKAAKQERLPGMEDAAIEEIEEKARDYAQIRDRRMALLKQEVDLKDVLLTLMKRHDKKSYKRDGLEINIVASEEKVKVRVKDEDKADEEKQA